MAYCFFLDEMMIPVPPEKLTMEIKGRNKTTELIDDGEINILRSPGLTEISFDIRLPGTPRPYADYNSSFGDSALSYVTTKLLGTNAGSALNYKGPSEYMTKLESLKNSKEPFNFVVTRDSGSASFCTSMQVTLEEYTIEESADEGFDVTIPVKLKQFKDYATKEVEVTTYENGNQVAKVKQNRRSVKSIASEIQVGKEKSLWEVVQRATNGTTSWRDVMKYNDLKNPFNLPEKGTKLNLEGYKSRISGSISDIVRK